MFNSNTIVTPSPFVLEIHLQQVLQIHLGNIIDNISEVWLKKYNLEVSTYIKI